VCYRAPREEGGSEVTEILYRGEPLAAHALNVLRDARNYLFDQMAGLRPQTMASDKLCDMYLAVHGEIRRRRNEPPSDDLDDSYPERKAQTMPSLNGDE
jgi:hypothetical protein